MINIDVLNRWSGKVQLTAEIDCAEDTLPRIKLGLAVRWAWEKGANLEGADLEGAEWTDDIVIQQVPIQIFGLAYPVTILDQHAQIDGQRALEFWHAHKNALLAIARSAGRGEEPASVEAAG